jgi:hypothetical protein
MPEPPALITFSFSSPHVPVSIGPQDTEDACRRLLGSLPSYSPFALLQDTKQQAMTAQQHAQQAGYRKQVEVSV